MYRFFLSAFLAVALGTLLVPDSVRGEETKKPWKVKSEASYLNSMGNTKSETFAGAAEFSGDYDPHRVFAKAGYLFSKTEGDTTASRGTASGRYEHTLFKGLFAFVEADYLRDRIAGYDDRINVGPGLGYDILKTDTQSLKALGSVLYTYVDYVDDGNDEYASGKLKGDYGWQISKATHFAEVVEYLVSFDDTDIYFLTSETKLETKLNSNLALALSYLVTYQNDPPPDSEYVDRIFLAALVLEY